MKLEQREYQTRAVAKLRQAFKNHQRVVAVGPTGSGKTVVAVKWIQARPRARVLWLAHRIELLRQAHEQLLSAGLAEAEVGTLSGVEIINPGARILVASVDMFRARPVPNVDVIVVDEAHRVIAKSYQDIVFARPKALVLGLTATPWRLDGTGLEDVFDEMVPIAGPTELIIGSFIAAPVTYGIPKEKALQIVRGVRSQGGDYASGQLGRAMMERSLMGDVVSECERLAPGQRTLVFAVNREHGRALWQRFVQADRVAEYLDAETPTAERKAMVKRLESGETGAIVNVDVLSEGFDCPPVKCIVLARPTKSLTRFLQQTGRASRPYGRKRPIILDHAGNCWRFGLPESEREWTLAGRPKGGGGEAPVKQCVECGVMIPAGCKRCLECGAEQPVPEHELQERQAELERIRATEAEKAAARQRVEKIALEKNAPPGWADKVIAAMFGAA
jgi:DNA repair protein RadD